MIVRLNDSMFQSNKMDMVDSVETAGAFNEMEAELPALMKQYYRLQQTVCHRIVRECFSVSEIQSQVSMPIVICCL